MKWRGVISLVVALLFGGSLAADAQPNAHAYAPITRLIIAQLTPEAETQSLSQLSRLFAEAIRP